MRDRERERERCVCFVHVFYECLSKDGGIPLINSHSTEG